MSLLLLLESREDIEIRHHIPSTYIYTENVPIKVVIVNRIDNRVLAYKDDDLEPKSKISN
jgi:hypothetical protein